MSEDPFIGFMETQMKHNEVVINHIRGNIQRDREIINFLEALLLDYSEVVSGIEGVHYSEVYNRIIKKATEIKEANDSEDEPNPSNILRIIK